MAHPCRILISTGEVSGDLQGSLLITALQTQAQQAQLELEIVALGGNRMAAAGAQLLGNTLSLGSVGLMESLRYVWPSLRLQRQVRQYLQTHPPDLVVLIDYAGVNLPMGRYLKRHFNVPILYYIAPQAWVVSNPTKATRQVVDLVDEVIAIFPREAQHFSENGASVTWVGHPLVDRMQQAPTREAARSQLGIPETQTAIALVPASRQQEIDYLLPTICAAARQIQTQSPQVHFWIPVSLDQYRPTILKAVEDYGLRATLTSESQLTLAAADVAIVKSGTVNLEAALLGIPQVVLYRLHPFSYWIFRHVLRYDIPFICPVNLVTGQLTVPELLQEQATPERVVAATLSLLKPQGRQQVLEGYEHLRKLLGEAGSVQRAAGRIVTYLINSEATACGVSE
ncbi:Lipid-A-disaccharide synthase [Acaryochloris thomasi RCC1774]|uniref:Lipid-A-disaccharide synthase n=1 Tax=Acaryochloris thomasi RCC1774 TaxID=1764569 RepID=A0A2W1JCW0_9CYAN|nr:lipid-A-disaccharide synthase [Acaryochloris thomasi]PZD71753.1 Lipid-A-disaccharide synthase [Acaryochloris thomasi RCC1774]